VVSALKAVGAPIPVRDETRSHLPANVDAHRRRQDRTQVKETNVEVVVVLHTEFLVPVAAAVCVRGGVEKRETARAASIVAHTQVQRSAARRDELARLVTQLNLRASNPTRSVR